MKYIMISGIFIFVGGLAFAVTDNRSQSAAVVARIDALEKQLAKQPSPKARQPAGKAAAARPIPIRPTDAFRGAEHAKVTVVEAYEFACPYCATIVPEIDRVMEKYGKDVKWVSKQFVVHPDTATDAALAVCAANIQGRFEPYEQALWRGAWSSGPRPRLRREGLKRDALKGLAKGLQMNVERFEADMDGPCRSRLTVEQRELRELGVRGTPTLFINGRPYRGPRTAIALGKRIEEEIPRADAALKGGVPLAQLYRHLARGAATP